ncbi:MAG: hypothetical protein ACOYYJ_10630 [Chloroflexota bacterium]
MTDEKNAELSERIHSELDEIPIVLARMKNGWEQARRSNDDLYLDGVALNLHGFYLGAERIFAHIAELIDGGAPQGEHWHLRLLDQMSAEIPRRRPPVISQETATKLDEYRRFRHIVRNVYTHVFDPVKIEKLVIDAFPLFERLKAELTAFIGLLEQD